jgi:hypothetical protein
MSPGSCKGYNQLGIFLLVIDHVLAIGMKLVPEKAGGDQQG